MTTAVALLFRDRLPTASHPTTAVAISTPPAVPIAEPGWSGRGSVFTARCAVLTVVTRDGAQGPLISTIVQPCEIETTIRYIIPR